MIGIKFLLTFVTVAFFAALFAALLLGLIFVVTWVIRLFIHGFGVTVRDHYEWVREHAPRRRNRCKEPYLVYSVETMELLLETCDLKLVQIFLKDRDNYVVVEPGKELKNA
jgi:hypothetical protein